MVRGGIVHMTFMRSLFLAICLFIFFLYLLPVTMVPNWMILPNFVFVLALALIVRRAAYLPFILLAFILCLQDFILSLPLGLGTFTGLICAEVLRSNRTMIREATFLSEWFFVSLILIGNTILTQILLTVTLTDFGSFSGLLVKLAMSILFYPIGALLIGIVFKVWKVTHDSDVQIGMPQ